MNESKGLTPEEVVARLSAAGFAAAEVYSKSGQSRRFEWDLKGVSQREKIELRRSVRSEERGWALRAGNEKGSMFLTGSGPPVWPELPQPMGLPLRLPDPELELSTVPSSGVTPEPLALAKESQARALFLSLDEAFQKEVRGGQLLTAVAEDGVSKSHLVSSKGLNSTGQRRLGTLRLWASAAAHNDAKRRLVEATVSVAAQALTEIDTHSLIRGLADRLLIQQQGESPNRSVERVALAPEVMARVLASISPLFTRPEIWPRLQSWCDSDQRLGEKPLTVIDDGGLVDGLLSCQFDDEGRRTGAITLIERGRPKQPLVPWFYEGQPAWGRNKADGSFKSQSSGCVWRTSWREPPVVAPSHLYLLPDQSVAVAHLLEDLTSGFYFVACGTPSVDWRKNSFHVSVLGFQIERGERVRPIKECRLRGELKTLLSGVIATARDLRFLPVGGMVGAPTTLVEGLEVLPEKRP